MVMGVGGATRKGGKEGEDEGEGKGRMREGEREEGVKENHRDKEKKG